MQIIAQSHTHIRLGRAIFVQRYAGGKTYVLKFSRAISAIEVVRLPVIGYKQIQLAVIVKIGPNRGQSITLFGISYSRFRGNIGKGPVSVVVVKSVRSPLQTARSALHIDPHILAGVT